MYDRARVMTAGLSPNGDMGTIGYYVMLYGDGEKEVARVEAEMGLKEAWELWYGPLRLKRKWIMEQLRLHYPMAYHVTVEWDC